MKKLLLSSLVLLCLSASSYAQKKAAPVKARSTTRISAADQQRIKVKTDLDKRGAVAAPETLTKEELQAETAPAMIAKERKAKSGSKN